MFLCRDDIKPTTKREESSVRMVPDQVNVLQLCFIHIYICSIDFIIRVAWSVINVQVSYYFQLAQQHQQQLQQNSGSPTQAQQVHFFLPKKCQSSVRVVVILNFFFHNLIATTELCTTKSTHGSFLSPTDCVQN